MEFLTKWARWSERAYLPQPRPLERNLRQTDRQNLSFIIIGQGRQFMIGNEVGLHHRFYPHPPRFSHISQQFLHCANTYLSFWTLLHTYFFRRTKLPLKNCWSSTGWFNCVANIATGVQPSPHQYCGCLCSSYDRLLVGLSLHKIKQKSTPNKTTWTFCPCHGYLLVLPSLLVILVLVTSSVWPVRVHQLVYIHCACIWV